MFGHRAAVAAAVRGGINGWHFTVLLLQTFAKLLGQRKFCFFFFSKDICISEPAGPRVLVFGQLFLFFFSVFFQ